jgi:hypothetical protein
MIDLMPVAEGLVSLVAIVVLGAIPFVLPALLRRLRIADNSALAQRIEVAAVAGAGAAYSYAMERIAAGGLTNVEVKNAALANGANYVLRSLPDTLHALKVDDEHVRQMVAARLGALMAQDPTVSILPGPAGRQSGQTKGEDLSTLPASTGPWGAPAPG